MSKAEFYHSTAWRKLSRAYLLSKNYICERCGSPAEICHHKKHLTEKNYRDPAISLNADNLEALCLACHNNEHFGCGGATAPGIGFDENGDVIPTERRKSKW